MHEVGNLVPTLVRLRRTGYVGDSDEDLQLAGNGYITTETLFQKFLTYMKENNPQEIDTWINARA